MVLDFFNIEPCQALHITACEVIPIRTYLLGIEFDCL